jgi:hypothetical protein
MAILAHLNPQALEKRVNKTEAIKAALKAFGAEAVQGVIPHNLEPQPQDSKLTQKVLAKFSEGGVTSHFPSLAVRIAEMFGGDRMLKDRDAARRLLNIFTCFAERGVMTAGDGSLYGVIDTNAAPPTPGQYRPTNIKATADQLEEAKTDPILARKLINSTGNLVLGQKLVGSKLNLYTYLRGSGIKLSIYDDHSAQLTFLDSFAGRGWGFLDSVIIGSIFGDHRLKDDDLRLRFPLLNTSFIEAMSAVAYSHIANSYIGAGSGVPIEVNGGRPGIFFSLIVNAIIPEGRRILPNSVIIRA